MKDMDNQQGEIMIVKEDIEVLYNELKSVRKVAQKLGVSKSTLGYYIKKYNINTINNKSNIKKHDLCKLLKEIGSPYKVAERLGVSPATVYNYIEKYEINIEDVRKRFPYTKEELIKLHKECGSITKVAAKLSRNYSTVRHWYSSLGIVFNDSGMTVYKELRETPMNRLHKSVLIGSMLGDGGLWLAPHCKNARLYVSHCEKQLPYLKWIHSMLQPFSRKITQTEKAGKKMLGNIEINGSNFYRFYTIAHPDITNLFHKYYREGLKGVDDSIIDKVDLTAMAIWFADDGSIERNRSGEPVACSIATNSFSYKEQLILIKVIRKFFSGRLKIRKQSGEYKGKPRSDFRIQMSYKDDVQKFLNTIKPVLPECIHYKLS